MTATSNGLSKFIFNTLLQLSALLSSEAQYDPQKYTLLALNFLITITNETIRLVEKEVPESSPHIFAGLANTMQLSGIPSF